MVKVVPTKEKLVCSHHVFFPPKAISEDKYRGKGRSIVWLYGNPPQPPNLSQCVSRATVVQILYLSYY